MPVLIDMARVSCSGMLRQRTPLGDSYLKIAGSDGIRSYAPMFFYLTVWFQREHCEALLAVTIMWHDFSFSGEVSQQRMS
jgi:hypothetical protein